MISNKDFPSLEAMFRDSKLQQQLVRLGLVATRVAWEDTGRTVNSSLGPNISDMTLSAPGGNAPVIRVSNFKDISVDLPIENIKVVVGNETASPSLKKSLPLKEYLEKISVYTGNSKLKSMYRERDAKVLASGQACILPLSEGKVPFHVELLNYQSRSGDGPAVLVILASAYGTSAQVVERGKTPLYLNENGTAFDFKAKRLQDDRKERGVPLEGPMTTEERERNVLYMVQIPLKVQEVNRQVRPRYFGTQVKVKAVNDFDCWGADEDTPQACFGVAAREKKGFDHAMLERGDEKGRFVGTKDLPLERDDRFPIRVTIQFYEVTDTPTDIPEAVLEEIAERITKIYSYGTNQGSLVVASSTNRPTAHTVPAISQPAVSFVGMTF